MLIEWRISLSRIKKGSVIVMSWLHFNTDEAIWGEDAKAFQSVLRAPLNVYYRPSYC